MTFLNYFIFLFSFIASRKPIVYKVVEQAGCTNNRDISGGDQGLGKEEKKKKKIKRKKKTS